MTRGIYLFLFIVLSSFLLLAGCGQPERPEPVIQEPIDPSARIGEITEFFSADLIPVEGYSIVGELNGTGSRQCPPNLKSYLSKYIKTELPEQTFNVDDFIDSADTAIVKVTGLMPAGIEKGKIFDVKVEPVEGSLSSSLKGGVLYGCDLRRIGGFQAGLPIIATAKGPVYIDPFENVGAVTGYVLGGGKTGDAFEISVTLNRPDYRLVRLIANRINDRFGGLYANPQSPGLMKLSVPKQYADRKQRFIDVVKMMSLDQEIDTSPENISRYADMLNKGMDKYEAEVALEAVGQKAVKTLVELSKSGDEDVKFRAARVLLYLDNMRGLAVLRGIVLDKDSEYRVRALETIGLGGRRNDIANIARMVLVEADDLEVMLAAYDLLDRINDISIKKNKINDNFYLEQIAITKRKMIYVKRSGVPGVVIFGAPLKTRKNIFVQTGDAMVTLNSPEELDHISIIRKHPKRSVNLKLSSTFDLENLIKRMSGSPSPMSKYDKPGLGIPYEDVAELLKKMTEKKAVDAFYHMSSLPEIQVK